MDTQNIQVPEMPKGIQATLINYFKDTEYFDLKAANELLLEHENRDINSESIRARIYEGINKGYFERVGKGLYTVTRQDDGGNDVTCMVINGDGRDLSMIPDNSVDSIITDHPYLLEKSLKGGNRNFANYDTFRYTEEDMREKFRILKQGHFLVEFLPEENGDNFEYLYQVKKIAKEAGLEYYATVPWKKGDFVANTGRKSKNTENVTFFTKGKARDLRVDAKKNKQYKESREIVEFKEHRDGFIGVSANDHGDSRTNIHEDIDVNLRLSVDKKDVLKVKELCEKYWWDFNLGFDDSPIKEELGYEVLDEMEAQDYILRCLDHDGIDYVDLSFGPENIFESKADVIVNPTNLLGPMGAGLAKAFKEEYPGLEEAYKKACESRYSNDFYDAGRPSTITAGDYASGLYAGDLYYYESPDKNKPDVLCFPTKGDWRNPSDLDLIEKGLKTFVKEYKGKKIQSVCFPKLGCGLGGLNWEKEVKPLMQKCFKDIDADIFICGDTLRKDEKEFFMSGAKGMLPTVFDVQPPKNKIHQAEKPVKLLEQILEFITFEQDIVLDQFAGSGVLGEAALNLNRNCILIEKSEKDYNQIIERLSKLGDIKTADKHTAEILSFTAGLADAMKETIQGENKAAVSEYTASHADMKLEDVVTELESLRVVDTRNQILIEQSVEDLKNLAEIKEKEPLILECSSRGDKRFSSIYAQITIGGKTASIEEFYQKAKRTNDGKVPGKGKPVDYFICPFSKEKQPASELSNFYKGLWITYLNQNPDLYEFAKNFDDFHDSFKGSSRNEQEDVIREYVRDKDGFTNSVRESNWYQTMLNHSKNKKKSLNEQIADAKAKTSTSISKDVKQLSLEL